MCLAAQIRNWNLDSNGNWEVNANWSPYFSGYTSNTFPNMTGAQAVFGGVISAPRTVTLSSTITLGSLVFAGATNYTLTGGTLSLDATGSGPATIQVSGSGAHTINSAVSLVDALVVDQDSTGVLTMGGVIANGGSGALTKKGTGTLLLTAANTINGAVTVDGGTLVLGGASGALASASGFLVRYLEGVSTLQLDNNPVANNNLNRIGNSAGVTLAGGTFDFNIDTAAAAAAFSETAGALTVGAGAGKVITDQAAATSTSTLTFASLARSAGGTLDFSGTGLGASTRNRVMFTSAPTLVNGIIGGWATVGSDWAAYGANGVAAYTGYYTGAQTGWGATVNARPSADQTLSANRSLNSLILDSGIDVAMGTRTLTIGTGGLLKSGGTVSIITTSTGTLRSGGSELIFTVVGGSLLSNNAAIANVPAGLSVVKSGDGTLLLTAASAYAGPTVLDGGVLGVGNRQALSASTLTLNSGGELQANWVDAVNYAPVTSITMTNGTIRRVISSASPTRYLANSGTANLVVAGVGQLVDVGTTAGGYLGLDGPVQVNDGGVLTLNAVNANSSVQLGGSQSITLAAGGTLATTGSGSKAVSSGSARSIVAQGTADKEAVFSVGSGTTYNAGTTLTINGSGSGGLRVTGASADVDNFLTAGRVSALAGSGGTLTWAYTDNGTYTMTKAPSAGSNVGMGFDAASTNVVYKLGGAPSDLANWNGLAVKGGRVELSYDESFTGGASGASSLEVSGGLLVLAGGSPVGGKTLTVEGDALLKGGLINAGPGGGSRGKLVVGGNIVSDGTVLQAAPDIEMNPVSGTVTVDGTAPLYGVGTFTKSGGGTVVLQEEITASTVEVKLGTLLLGNDNRIGGTATIKLSGGTLATGGYSDTVGVLSLTANSRLDFGSGASVLTFANSSALPWSGNTLTITNWSGSSGGGGTDQLHFGSGGLTGSQLAGITFSDPFGGGSGSYAAQMLASGEVVPILVPEPAAVGVLGVLVGALGWRTRRQWLARLRHWLA